MPDYSISTILGLIGDLKDNDPAQTRFRGFLEKEVKDIGLVRDFMNECLANTGDQYTFAFQDLIVYLGKFLGFSRYEYGRYRGTQNVSGHDGIWFTHDGFSVVIEVKKTDAYAINTEVILNYIERLVSDGTIKNSDCALGLFVVGKINPEIRQLEDSIIAKKRTDRMRVISAEGLMSLAEIMNDFDVSHDDIVAILKPGKPIIDPTIDLLTRIIQPPDQPYPPRAESTDAGEEPVKTDTQYWITPVKSTDEESAEECIQKLVGDEHIYAFGEKTPGRASIRVDDRICFYATTTGIVAHAIVASLPEKKRNPKVRDIEQYPWLFKLKNVKLYLDEPVVIDAPFRSQLDAFKGKDVIGRWAWFVQGTHRVSVNDFSLLTQAKK